MSEPKAERVERLKLVEQSFREHIENTDRPFIHMPRSSALLLVDDLAEAIALIGSTGTFAENASH